MIAIGKRLLRGLRWRAHALLGTGRHLPVDPVGTTYDGTAVADYYDEFTDAYLDATGPFLQAFRGQDTDAAMEYYVERCGLSDGMSVLDAGCGVGAPAIWLAQRFPAMRIEALTISPLQAEKARAAIQEAGVVDRVNVRAGDYHHLSQIYDHGQFDRALFLESLGHSADMARVLYGVRDVLMPGGTAYIKDFFQRRSRNPDVQAKIDRAAATINTNYCYHVMQLPDLIATCLETGFTIDSLQPPALEPDLGLTIDFEHRAKRLTYPVFARTHAVDWYDLIVRRE